MKNEKALVKVILAATVLLVALGTIFNNNRVLNSRWFLNDNETEEEEQRRRGLSRNLGEGRCLWERAVDADQDADLFTTLIAAYPGSGKRTAWLQLEGLVGLIAADDHNLSPASSKNYAFLKTSYPHHEGYWSWAGKGGQVILVVRNPRWAIPSYHTLLYEINYAKIWQEAYANIDKVFTTRPPLEAWYRWRSLRFESEIHWWSWTIDYWMEGGLYRDLYTHELTIPEHVVKIMQPHNYGEQELARSQALVPKDVEPHYDDHCVYDLEDCKPVTIASFERMVDPVTGPGEVNKITSMVEDKEGVESFVIEEEARACIWDELMVSHKGGRNFHNRDENGNAREEYKFTVEQMEMIIKELEYVRDKYSSDEWSDNPIAQDLVGYVETYIAENTSELVTAVSNIASLS